MEKNKNPEVYNSYYTDKMYDFIEDKCDLTIYKSIINIGCKANLVKPLVEKGYMVKGIINEFNIANNVQKELNDYQNFECHFIPYTYTLLDDHLADLIIIDKNIYVFDKKLFKEEIDRITSRTYNICLLNNEFIDNEIINEIININKVNVKENNDFKKLLLKKSTTSFKQKKIMKLNVKEFINYFINSIYTPHFDQKNNYLENLIKIFNKYSTNGYIYLPSIETCEICKIKKKGKI